MELSINSSIPKNHITDKVWRRFLVLLAAIQIASVPICSYSHELDLLKFPQIIALLLACVWAISTIIKPGSLYFPFALILYLIFGFWCGITLWLSPYSTGYTFYLSLLKVIAVSLIVSDIVKDKESLLTILLIFSLSIVIIYILNKGSLQVLYSVEETVQRLSGTLGNANILGMYGVVVAWACVTYWYGSESPYRHLILALLPLAFYLTLYSGSRKGLIGIALLSICIFYIVLKSNKKSVPSKMALFAIGSACLFIVFYLIYHSNFYFRLEKLWHPESIKAGTSASDRILLFFTALKMWSQNPIAGLGFEQFRHYFGTYSHSTVSETLASTGLVGFLLYFGSLAALLFKTMKAIKEEARLVATRIMRLVATWIMVFIFFNIFAVMYMDRFMWPLIGAVAGYISSAQKSRRAPTLSK